MFCPWMMFTVFRSDVLGIGMLIILISLISVFLDRPFSSFEKNADQSFGLDAIVFEFISE